MGAANARCMCRPGKLKCCVRLAEAICATAKRDIAELCQSSGMLSKLVATGCPSTSQKMGALVSSQVRPHGQASCCA